MELRVQVDDGFMQRLQEKMKTNKSTEVAREALTLLNWAVGEKSEGRSIASVSNGDVYAKLALPSLDKVSES